MNAPIGNGRSRRWKLAAKGITDTTADESPSFAPNSRLILYVTQIDGHEALMTTSLDGQTKTKLAGNSGDIRQASWGPFNKG